MAMLLRPGALRRLRVLTAESPFLASRASFFSFPSPSRSLVKSHTETRVVPFSCSEMFDVVADVDRYSEFLPFCAQSRVLRRPNDNVMEAALRVGFNIFTESYTSRVLMIRPNKIAVKAIDSPTFKRIESEWIFKPCATPGSCEIHFKVTFEVSSFLHANAIQLFFDDVALTQLNAFIGRARKIYATAPRPIPQAPVQAEPAPLTAAKTVATEGTDSSVPKAATTIDEGDEAARREAKARASRRIKGGISTQNYSDLAAVFEEYAEKDGKLYYGGFTAACMALSDEYDDMRDISESAALAGAVFSSFETHATPKDWLTLDEFVVGVYLMTKGTFEQKAHSLFEVVNKTGDGKITREELTQAMQRRIRAVKKLFPKLLRDQVQIQMMNEQVEELSSVQDAAVASSVQAIEQLMEEVEKEIPLAVNQIFREADLDQDDYIREQEWLFAWQAHPEFVELLTIDGMKKMAQWASVVQEANTNDDDDNTTGSSGQSLDTRLTYVD
ncbi:Coenzyme Q-binding protein coq10, mitochondrial [Phytophthora pseudosyringae]|uniref:Coenzyme Q-binding protein coq10, mitochondrial n=1 Tax=Phytophthora pseudosyringae TaxID=221518 RepID=A0A8T1VS53_9STRA|nr:Coenzyme Q-binding protein coq10, mitochondrial [Phytophthora pseudosyringae]